MLAKSLRHQIPPEIPQFVLFPPQKRPAKLPHHCSLQSHFGDAVLAAAKKACLADFNLGGGFHSRSVGSAHAAWLTAAWRSSPGDLTLLASVDTYMFIPTHRHVHPSKTKARITDAEDWRADREVCRSCLSHSRAVLGRGHKGSDFSYCPRTQGCI